ncbi:MAG TPA: PAS domain S-box protein, partial [Oscillatoriaceae cyanobacterium]
MLVDYARYLKEHHLPELAAEDLRLLRAFDVPLMKIVAHYSEDDLQKMTEQGLAKFLDELAEGRAIEVASESLRAWEEDRLPGVPKEAIEPSDLVLVYVAQKEAILAFLPRYTQDVSVALGIVMDLEEMYRQMQDAAFGVYAKLQKQAAAQARQFELMVKNVADYAIYLLDTEGRIRTWNEAAQRFKGYTADEIIGQSFDRFYTPEDRAAGKPQRALAEALAKGHYESEGWRVRKDGTRFWADALLTPIYDNGQLVGFAKITRDLSERKAASDALQAANEELYAANEELHAANEELTAQSEELQSQQEELMHQSAELAQQRRFLDNLVSHMPVALAFVDASLVFRWVNPAWTDVVGIASEQVVGRTMLDVQAPPDIVAHAQTALEQRELVKVTARPSLRDQGMYMDVIYVPVVAVDHGTVDGVLTVGLDVSDRVQREKLQGEQIVSMQRVEKLKDQFLSILSHELRTPINAIMGFGSILADGLA